ncbi:MAG: hypothetical protein AB7F86_16140 [Bdellovibrionales bacterium]
MISRFIWTLGFVLLGGCASITAPRESVRIPDVQGSLNQIRAAVMSAIPIGQRSVSANGRVILSKHFLPAGDQYRNAADAVQRYYAQFSILGDRRPYEVQIVVVHEKRVLRGESFTYVVDYYDMLQAKELERRFQEELTKRREDRNIIDDFRVF